MTVDEILAFPKDQCGTMTLTLKDGTVVVEKTVSCVLSPDDIVRTWVEVVGRLSDALEEGAQDVRIVLVDGKETND